MCTVEDMESFDVCQKLVFQNADGKLDPHNNINCNVISSYPYYVCLGDIDEDKKAEVEDEEIRCAQELFEGFRAEEVEYPIFRRIRSDGNEQMLEENFEGEPDRIFNK